DASILALTAQDQTAVERGRRVVGMSLDLARQTQRIQCGLRRGDGFEQTQARDRGGSAASESGPNGDFASDFEPETRRTRAGPLAREPKSTRDPVVVRHGTVDEVEVQGVR